EAPGELKNCARVQFEHGQCVCTKIGGGAPAIVPQAGGEAKLNLTMTGPAEGYANIPATYYLTVSHPGTAPAPHALLLTLLPEGSTLVSASGGGKVTPSQITWGLGTLAPGVSRTFRVILRAKAAGELCNRASALADDIPAVHAEACTEFKGVSALSMEV